MDNTDDTVLFINKNLVLSAVKTLKCLRTVYIESSQTLPLLEDATSSTLFMQIQLKKVPQRKFVKRIKVKLPHSLVNDTTEVCLITGDVDKKDRKAEIEPDKQHFKELLNKHGVTNISEVITLRELRTEFKSYESKLKLLAAYDVFLADNKIAECLPKLLGKHFFKKRKFPISINMQTSNLKNQIDNALLSKVFHLTCHGNCCVFEVANLDMTDEEIFDNYMASVNILTGHMPGNIDNIMGIYLKTVKSKALPVYISYSSPNNIVLPQEVVEDDFEIGELTTMPNAHVKVFNDGTVEAIRHHSSKNSKRKKSERSESDLSITISPNENGGSTSDSELEEIKPKTDKISVGEIKITDSELVDEPQKTDKTSKKAVKKRSGRNVFDDGSDVGFIQISHKTIKKEKKDLKKIPTDSELEDEPKMNKKAKNKVTEEISSTNGDVDEDAEISTQRIKKSKKMKNAKLKELKTESELEDETFEKSEKARKKSTENKLSTNFVEDEDAEISPQKIKKSKKMKHAKVTEFQTDSELEDNPKMNSKSKNTKIKLTEEILSTNGGVDEDAEMTTQRIKKSKKMKDRKLKELKTDLSVEDGGISTNIRKRTESSSEELETIQEATEAKKKMKAEKVSAKKSSLKQRMKNEKKQKHSRK